MLGLKWFTKPKQKKRKIVKKPIKKKNTLLAEEYVFKMDFWQFWVKRLDSGSTEFWAHCVDENKAMSWNMTDKGKHVLLGKFVNGDFTPEDYYYNLPRLYQKGAERLRRKMMGQNHGWGEW